MISTPRLRYTITGACGVGFETPTGGFFVRTVCVEGAHERARQEWASGRAVTSAALYAGGKVARIIDWRDFEEHAAACGCLDCMPDPVDH